MYVQWHASMFCGVKNPPCCSFSLFQSSSKFTFHHGNTLSSIAFVPSHPFVLFCYSIVKMSLTTSSCSCFHVGELYFLKHYRCSQQATLGSCMGPGLQKCTFQDWLPAAKSKKALMIGVWDIWSVNFSRRCPEEDQRRLESSVPKVNPLMAVFTWNTFWLSILIYSKPLWKLQQPNWVKN